jgi:hypothetical protein
VFVMECRGGGGSCLATSMRRPLAPLISEALFLSATRLCRQREWREPSFPHDRCDFISYGCHDFAAHIGAALIINAPDAMSPINMVRQRAWCVAISSSERGREGVTSHVALRSMEPSPAEWGRPGVC